MNSAQSPEPRATGRAWWRTFRPELDTGTLILLASLFFIYRMSELTKIERLPMDEEAHDPRFMYPDGTMRVATWQMFGSLFFGAVNKLEELLDPREGHPEIDILDMTRLIQLDTTGLEGLENLRDKLQKRGCTLLVCGLNSQPDRKSVV